jgi:hypothetical protein
MPAPETGATTVLSAPGGDTAADTANATEVISAAASPAGPAVAAAAATPTPRIGAGGTLPGGTGDGQSRGRLIAVAAVAVVAVLIVVGLALAANRSGDNAPTAAAGTGTTTTAENPDQSSPNVVGPAQQESPVATTTPAPQPSSSAASATPSPSAKPTTTRPPATTTVTTAPFGPATTDRIAQFIQGYYGMLPGNVGAAWTQLSPSYQAQTGGSDAYARFWSTIRSVSVGAITPNGENRAVVSLTYNLNNGSTSSENRWIQVASDNGRLLIAASGT